MRLNIAPDQTGLLAGRRRQVVVDPSDSPDNLKNRICKPAYTAGWVDFEPCTLPPGGSGCVTLDVEDVNLDATLGVLRPRSYQVAFDQ